MSVILFTVEYFSLHYISYVSLTLSINFSTFLEGFKLSGDSRNVIFTPLFLLVE